MTTPPREPVRWKHLDGGLPGAARSVVASASGDGADDAAIRRLGARLLPVLTAPPVASPGPSLLAKGLVTKLLLSTTLVAAAGGGWMATHRAPTDAPASPISRTARAPSASAVSVVEGSPASTAIPAAPEVVVAPPPESVRRVVALPNVAPPPGLSPAAPSPSSEAGARSDELRSEIDLLQRARGALVTNPGEALALTEEHRRRVLRPALVEEREVVAIEALSRLGQTGAARTRAEAFFHSFPNSVHAARLRARLGMPAAPR